MCGFHLFRAFICSFLLFHTGATSGGVGIPLPFRIRRILLPVRSYVSFCIAPSSSSTISCQLTSDNLDLGNTVRVTEDDTNLRWSGTLLCELADLVNDLLWSGLEPCWSSARVWDGRGRNSLSVAVKTTHFEGSCRLLETESILRRA